MLLSLSAGHLLNAGQPPSSHSPLQLRASTRVCATELTVLPSCVSARTDWLLLCSVLYLCIALNFPLPAGSLALTLASLALHAKLSAALCFIAHKQPQPAPPAEPASIAKRGAGVRPATGRSAASGGAQAERALLQELDVEEEEEEEQGGSDEAKRRGALADRAFAATLSKRM